MNAKSPNTLKLVTAPEGYNGRRILFFAAPLACDGPAVKLRCAEPGMEGLIAWRRVSDLVEVAE